MQPGFIPAWQRPGLHGCRATVRRFAEPRLLMTAAMAFFSIALTLNLTGVRLSSLRLADLRPTAVRSFMERRLTMASTPIIRYYDHLRFVYEVESRCGNCAAPQRERRGAERTQPAESRKTPRRASPSRTPGHKDGGSRMDPPQQSGTRRPALDDSNDF
jgi:hypothetical protein